MIQLNATTDVFSALKHSGQMHGARLESSLTSGMGPKLRRVNDGGWTKAVSVARCPK